MPEPTINFSATFSPTVGDEPSGYEFNVVERKLASVIETKNISRADSVLAEKPRKYSDKANQSPKMDPSVGKGKEVDRAAGCRCVIL